MKTPDRQATLALAALLFCAAAAPAGARGVPGRPVTEAAPPLVSPETGAFNCGTYRGSHLEASYHHSQAVAMRRAVASGRASVRPAASYIYDDVWVVEDDGTLTISGTNTFDTQTTTFRFTPNGAGGYDVATVPYVLDVSFLTHENLGLADDDFRVRALSFTFPFFGVSWGEVYVGSNGVIALGANPNPSGFFSPDDFFDDTPKMCPYYMDLDPSTGTGSPAVYFNSAGDSAVVTWSAINEYGSANKNSFQVILRADGTIDFVMIGIQSTTGGGSGRALMGIRPGGAPPYEVISFSNALPYSGGAGAGIYEDYRSLANPMVNETALGRRFYQAFPDSFFQYVFFTNFPQTQAGFANERNISNAVTGIGLDLFDNSALFGSAGVLESRCNMNQLAVWTSTDPAVRFRGTQSFLTIMGQESGHRWGAFVRFRDGGGQISNLILGRSDAHWNYYADVDHSCLEGGNWDEVSPGSYTCPDLVNLFCQLDEYLFGLRTAEEVSDIFFVSSTANNQPAARSQPPPPIGAQAFGTPVTVTVDDVISAEGLRTPLPADEEKDLRQAFIILVQNGTAPTQADLDKIAGYRRAWESYFERSCDGRVSLNTSLTRTFPVAGVEGHVTSSESGLPVLDLRVRSLGRGFNQRVPAGGRYAFRYLANASSGAGEAVTLIFSAPEFHPDTVTTTLAYGTETTIDVTLDPLANAVLVEAFDARPAGASVVLTWRIFADELVRGVRVYRAGDDGPIRDVSGLVNEDATRWTDYGVAFGASYEYVLGVVRADGSEARSRPVQVTVAPAQTALHQNHPNPFNPQTEIAFTLSERGRVRLAVYTVSGALVTTLYDAVAPAGITRVPWDGRDAAGRPVGSGVYLYRLEGQGPAQSRKMVLAR